MCIYRNVLLCFLRIAGWIRGLYDLMEKHYCSDHRDHVRIKSLHVLLDMFKSNRHMYEEELVEKVVIPFLKPLDAETSVQVRLAGIKVGSSGQDSLSPALRA